MGDSVLYTKDNIQSLSTDYYWVSGVPESLKSVKEVVHEHTEALAQTDQKRAIACVSSDYAGIQQC